MFCPMDIQVSWWKMAPRGDLEHTASRIKATGARADRLAPLIKTQQQQFRDIDRHELNSRSLPTG